MDTQPTISLPPHFDGPATTSPRNSFRTASAGNSGDIPADTDTQRDSLPSPPPFVRPTTPMTPAEMRDPSPIGLPSPRFLSVKIVNTTQPPLYEYITKRSRSRKFWDAITHWVHLVWLDILFMLLTALALGAIYLWAPLFRWKDRRFPVEWDPNYRVWRGPVELSYDRCHEDFVMSDVGVSLILNLIPAVVFNGLQYWVRDVWDLTAATFGLMKGMIMIQFISITLKVYLVELRPTFMDVCGSLQLPPITVTPPGPSQSIIRFATPLDCAINTLQKDHPTHSILQGDLKFAMQSFPSGHTASATLVGTYLALYLNAKLKSFSSYHTSFWKMLVVLGPVIGAAFIAGSLVSDHSHHVHDILLSIPLGIAIALLAYRAHYASIFDYKTNHMYLPWSATNRSVSFLSNPPMVAGTQQNVDPSVSKKRDKTAVPWPRVQKSRSEKNQNEGMATGLSLDGTAELSRRVHGPSVLRGGRARQDLFPREESMVMVSEGGDESVLRGDDGNDVVGTDSGTGMIPSVRRHVGEWADVGGSVRRVNYRSGGAMV